MIILKSCKKHHFEKRPDLDLREEEIIFDIHCTI